MGLPRGVTAPRNERIGVRPLTLNRGRFGGLKRTHYLQELKAAKIFVSRVKPLNSI